MLMRNGNGAVHFSGNGIADFIRAGDRGEDEDMISNTDLPIWPLITEKIHLLYPQPVPSLNEKPSCHSELGSESKDKSDPETSSG
jgi:hypothetical protein